MPVNIPYRIVGEVVILSPEGSLIGTASGPLKIVIKELLESGNRKFIVSFKNVVSLDRPYATSLNSIYKEVIRHDGKMILCDAGFDVIPWLEQCTPDIPTYKSEEIALSKLTKISPTGTKGNIAVVGESDISRVLFKGASNYKGLIFYYFNDPIRSTESVIDINPLGIILNLESGTTALESIRRWRFHEATSNTPIILYGPASRKSIAPALIREGASDFIEVKFEGAEVLAYLKPLEFRNILAKKLDMILSGNYKR